MNRRLAILGAVLLVVLNATAAVLAPTLLVFVWIVWSSFWYGYRVLGRAL
jgi:hypothetical protein